MALLNVPGRFDVKLRPGSVVFLHPMKKTLLEHAIYPADHCTPFWKLPVDGTCYFHMECPAAEKYVLFLTLKRFEEVIGFGLPDEPDS